MNYTMTPREALAIQARHIAHYSQLRADLAEFVASQTDVAGLDLDKPLAIFEINKRIPRGGAIEVFCGINIKQGD